MWLFIDDIDEAGAKDKRGSFDYSACWAIIAAAIELSEDIESLKCIISVRTDIWHLMTKTHKHGSERKDKIGQIHELKFSEDDLRSIFNKRIELATNDAKLPNNLSAFFQQNNITLPGVSGAQRSWDQWIAKQARYRPRDLVKAVQMLIQSAKASKSKLIGDAQAHSILYEYGSQRIDNIFDEYGQICPQIKEIINDLTEKNTYSFLEIMEKLKKSPSRRAVQIDGISMQSTNEHAIKLLRILHMACFINPREGEDDDYKHYNYNDHPDFVDFAKFNDLQRYSWQIHPTFHSYASKKREEAKFK